MNGVALEPIKRWAVISPDGMYRYRLGRRWDHAGPLARFVMLNPSTADGLSDDPTIRRCMGFARSWGWSGIHVFNLYAYRATKPADLWSAADPVGSDNDDHLRTMLADDGPIIAAWGANARPDRVSAVRFILRTVPVWCLGVTKGNQPKHPLYLRADTQLCGFWG